MEKFSLLKIHCSLLPAILWWSIIMVHGVTDCDTSGLMSIYTGPVDCLDLSLQN